MNKILVDAFTFEVARAMDADSRGQVGGNLDGKHEQRRLVAIILALRAMGLVIADDDDDAISICFSEQAKDLRGNVSDARLWELAKHKVCFRLMRQEMSRSIKLAKKYRETLDQPTLRDNWREVGAIIDLILIGDLRLMGPEFESGLIVEDLSRSTAEARHLAWYSLGHKANRGLRIVDLAEPEIIKGYHRFRIGSAISALERGREFVTYHGISRSASSGA
ncbi:hypothetical protein [Bradyrhizobium sp. 62]|uniref:hypothetical protein n=1 Tax=Bradyrhizobium sp. 62 TaxID=1043588 RepID=UPI001FFB3AEA|nr:hypothetical protein [Bradyrhizobium sp. 62]MCK1364080.1 hypothetical protein [Bradyrhizobium sp. 62]